MPSKRQRRAKKLKQLQANIHTGSTGNRRASMFGYNLTGTYHNANNNVDYWDSAGYPKLLNFGDHWICSLITLGVGVNHRHAILHQEYKHIINTTINR